MKKKLDPRSKYRRAVKNKPRVKTTTNKKGIDKRIAQV